MDYFISEVTDDQGQKYMLNFQISSNWVQDGLKYFKEPHYG